MLSLVMATAFVLTPQPPNTVVKLSSTEYTSVTATNLNLNNVTIDATEAKVDTLTITKSSGITVKGGNVPPADAGGSDPKTVYPWNVVNSSNINLNGFSAKGTAVLSTATSFLTITNSTNVSVTGTCYGVHDCIDHVKSPGLVVSLQCSSVFDDCLRGDAASFTVNGITCSGDHPDPTDDDHPDCVQVWPINYPSGSPTAGGSILIRSLKLVKGAGSTVHGFFLRSDFDGFGAAAYPALVEIDSGNLQGPGDDCIYIHGAKKALVKNVICQAIPCTDNLQSKAGFWFAGVTNWVLTNNQGAVFAINQDTPMSQPPPTGNKILACHN